MDRRPRKVTLRKLQLTELSDADTEGAKRHSLPDGSAYWTRPLPCTGNTLAPLRSALEFDAFPLVLCGDGAPWHEANTFLLEGASSYGRSAATTVALADDLTAFLCFIESAELDWRSFPAHRNAKPTYRYRGYLVHEVWSGNLMVSTAKRRMGAVIRFYRWAIGNGTISPVSAPWRDADKLISVSSDFGLSKPVRVKTTDLAISIPVQSGESGARIDDGGKLRPLSKTEQQWVITALEALGNTEMLLIHLFGLLTGARIQTVLTFKLKPALEVDVKEGFLYYPVGPGTGIDTKGGKKQSLYLPRWFYEVLKTYACSDRRRGRLGRSSSELAKEYLFLSTRGDPMYVARQDEPVIQAYGGRHRKTGQAVRQYMKDYVLPYVRERHDRDFSYQFHDLRATFGMNLVDQFADDMASGQVSYTSVLNLIQGRMCHSSPTTTERYLNFRTKQKLVEAVQNDWEEHLAAFTRRALGAEDANL